MSKRKKGGGAPKRAREEDYARALNQFIDRVYDEAAGRGWRWAQLAREAQLSSGTVSRLGKRLTLLPEYRTVFRLAKAVGMELELRWIRGKRDAA